jgi:hypothetical protein
MTSARWLACAIVLASACGGRITPTQTEADGSIDAPGPGPVADAPAIDDAAPADVVSSSDVSTLEAGASDGTTGSSTPGCPPHEPTAGQSCSSLVGIPAEHFYCHYFTKGATCADEWKCSDKDGDPATTFFFAFNNCGFAPDACAEGKPCGDVSEPSGACVVECDRICHCGPSGTLVCDATSCP